MSDPESLLLVLPADHYIGRPEDLRDAVIAAVDVASDQKLVTFGLIPSRPETATAISNEARISLSMPPSSKVLLKSQTLKKQKHTLRLVSTYGTAACSCSRSSVPVCLGIESAGYSDCL